MKNQLTLPLFKNEIAEKSFEFYFESKTKTDGLSRQCYVRRGVKGQLERGHKAPNESDYTFVYIPEFNMLGQACFTLFRLMTEGESKGSDLVIPELQTMPKERIIEFVESIIQRHNEDAFGWDYVNRCRLYTCPIN